MQIGRLVAVIEADAAGLRSGLSDATAMIEGYETTVSKAAGVGTDFAAATAIARTSAAASAGAGTLGKWSGALGTVASAATVASGAVNVVGGSIKAIRAVQAAGGLARFAGSLKLSTGGVKAMLPPTRTLLKVLAGGAAVYATVRGVRSLTRAAGTAKRAVGGLAREVGTLGPLRRLVGGLAGSFGPLGLAVGGAAGGLAGLAGIGASAGWGIKLSAQAETARVAFTTLTGSAETATKLIRQLETFSAGTPFTLPGIQESARKLLAYGRDASSIAGDLAVLGDLAAGTGKPLNDLADIYGRVRSTGQVTGDVLNRLAERGVPIYKAFADTMGVAETEVKGLVSTGAVGFADLQRALELTTKEGGLFAGAMASQSRTLAGMWSTLTDNFREGFRKAFEGASAFFNLPGLLREVTQYVTAGATVLADYAAGWKAAAGEGIDWGGAVTSAVKWVGDAIALATDTVFYLGTGFLKMSASAVGGIAAVVRGMDSAARAAVEWANVLPGVEVAYAGTLAAVAAGLDATAAATRATALGIENMAPPGDRVRGFFAEVENEIAKVRDAAGEVSREGLDIGGDVSGPDEALKRFAEQTAEAVRTPFEAFAEERDRLKQALAAGLLSDDVFGKAIAKARAEFEANVEGDGGGRSSAGRSNVGSLERGSQAAFAAVNDRIRGSVDRKAEEKQTAKNTAKMAALLAQVAKNTADIKPAAPIEAGPPV